MKKKVKPYGRKEAIEFGRMGGLLGGPARALKLSPERRREIAQRAANALWAKRRAAEES